MSIKNPPFVTIALILVNCIVFFAFLSPDTKLYREAEEYYVGSDLALIEAKAFEQYRKFGRVMSLTPTEVNGSRYPKAKLYPLINQMRGDREFMDRLRKGEIITPDLEIHPLWKEKRDHLEGILSETSSMAFGFRPAYWDLQGMFTHMFLHGGFMHLLGNMVFLWLAGCVVELAWGRIAYLVIYLAGGLSAAALFGLANLASTQPLVGASGAISALMGAYAVLYGRRKIKVFYSLGFFFNYTMVPGFVILVLWIGNEFFQLLIDKGSHVAYLAHVGGFFGGALLAFLCQRYLGQADKRALDSGGEDGVPQLMDQALRKVETLDIAGARALFVQVLGKEPDNRAALMQMFHLDKLTPGSVEFHDSTRKLITHLMKDRQAHWETRAVYREYLEKSRGPKLPRTMVFSLIPYFASTGHLDEAEGIVGMLMKKAPDLPRLPESLLYLARACLKENNREKARSYLQVICLRYPNSRECTVARRILEDQET